MARIMAIDYGTKRVGLAVTDPLQIIASALDTIDEHKILDYLKTYFLKEDVEKVLIGYPTQDDGTDTHNTPHVRIFIEKFKELFPDKIFELRDEAFTSKLAMQAMVNAGVKKKQRREKGNLDKLSATIILQEYLG
jgi:putative holliday junction resolvase